MLNYFPGGVSILALAVRLTGGVTQFESFLDLQVICETRQGGVEMKPHNFNSPAKEFTQ
jgi:hypothetical protein